MDFPHEKTTASTKSFRPSIYRNSNSFRSVNRRIQDKRWTRGILIGLTLLIFWICMPVRFIERGYLPCRHLPGASDTLVIMKTGVTELEDRLPAHLENTLKCPLHTVIFSDHSELYQGKWRIRDVLANVDPKIQQNNDDFALWRRVKEVGREGLEAEALTGTRTTSKTSAEDKMVVAGWVLDKWKFIPMMTETFHLYPDKKWYVFIESDTYLFWSTTLKYISTLDHTEPHVLGHRTSHKADHLFMQGGSGYVLSHEALRRASNYIQANQQKLDEFVAAGWAGDIILGQVFIDADVPMTYSWPIFQPSFFGMVDFGLTLERRRYWCYPAASFHHMTPEAIEDMWSMEQQWVAEENDESNPYKYLRLADVFNNLMLPRMRFARTDWDNQATKIREDTHTIGACKQTCEEDSTCMQYVFDGRSGECRTSSIIKMGEASLGSGLYSDWIFDRIEKWRDDQPDCVRESFLYYGDIDEVL